MRNGILIDQTFAHLWSLKLANKHF